MNGIRLCWSTQERRVNGSDRHIEAGVRANPEGVDCAVAGGRGHIRVQTNKLVPV